MTIDNRRHRSHRRAKTGVVPIKFANTAAASCLLLFALIALPRQGLSGERITPDIPGPRLQNPNSGPGRLAYNQAIDLYQARNYTSALGKIRDAIRSRELSGRALGFGFANLCLIYLKNREYKQALAACVKAKRILPGYSPVVVNLRRAKQHRTID